jgi:hypothetical protein
MTPVATEQGVTDVRYFASGFDHACTFSVCSLVADQAKYDRLLRSFNAHGFTSENTEFLAADNRGRNDFDGYSWQRRLYPECSGQYIVFTHDDVELIDEGYDELLARLQGLTKHDPDWVLAGNAGGVRGRTYDPERRYGFHLARSLHAKWRSYDIRRPYVQVESLDENFMVMRRERFVAGSLDLGGFHHYGPDLCLIGEILGGTSYVVNFKLKHHGGGDTGEAYQKSRDRFAEKYRKHFPERVLVTTTGPVFLAN